MSGEVGVSCTRLRIPVFFSVSYVPVPFMQLVLFSFL